VPLLDHFAPDFRRLRSWRSFHSAWATNMAQRLNQGRLPPFYRAEPLTQIGAVEIDVATVKNGAGGAPPPAPAGGPTWSAPDPALTATVNLAAVDVVEVRVLYRGDDEELKAAVEIVSPSNKDRPASRHAFAVKCADILRRGASLVVVDIVTDRHASPHAELLEVVEAEPGAEWEAGTRLSAVAYRTVPGDGPNRLQLWPAELSIGAPLPTVPLWLGEDGAIPLDLEASYELTCELLMVRT
jgi:hypothetical protein